MKLIPILAFVLLSIFSPVTKVSAQSQEKIYSLFLMNFARGIDWSAAKREHFTIDVLSYPPLEAELIGLCSKTKINGKKIEVRLINDLSEARGQILFLPAFKAKLLPKALERQLLVVSNSPGIARRGGALNFVLSNGKLSYEINVRSIESLGLKVGTSLRSSGTVVESLN